MLQWLSDIVPLCSAWHDVCSWLPHLPCQVSYFLYLWMLRMTVVDFSLPRQICFDQFQVYFNTIPVGTWPIWYRDPMVVARNIDADGDVDAGSDDLGDIPGQSGHQRSQILFSYKAHCDPEETFSPLWPWRGCWYDWDIQVWSLAPAWPRMTTNIFNNNKE